MGHVRLGRIPATRQWKQVIEYLKLGDISVTQLATAVADASEKSLIKATSDPVFLEALCMLGKLPQMVKEHGVQAGLAKVGIQVSANPSAVEILTGVNSAIETVQRTPGAKTTDLGEMAKQAAVHALSEAINDFGPQLWTPNNTDVHTTVASFAAPEKFGELAYRFFANVAERNLKYYTDRMIPHYLGSDRVKSVGDMAGFDNALGLHCKEAALIMRPFAKDWHGKLVFQSKKPIDAKNVKGFADVSFKKINKEFAIRGNANGTA
ncbi:MAG: hypothetical protein EBQ92_00950 [Proteobacteria bacterium]|nr:hypothetical protein [Pseudomonadota bacterium]